MRERVAIVLFNLGGPDRPEAVAPFLLNLFKDPAILRVPFFVRPFLARLIAKRRTKPALENYAMIGGKSPLLALTQAGMSREDSYALVQRNAMKVWESDGQLSLLDLLKNDAEVSERLPAKHLDALFDLNYHLKHVDTIFDRVFGSDE